jgi:hypothetical protein
MPRVIYIFGLIYHRERYESISGAAAAASVPIAYRSVLSESMRAPSIVTSIVTHNIALYRRNIIAAR